MKDKPSIYSHKYFTDEGAFMFIKTVYHEGTPHETMWQEIRTLRLWRLH